jgi:hypothetical protein
MSPSAERLFDAAMELSADERIALIGRLLETTPDQPIGPPPDDADLLEELDRRYADSAGAVTWVELRAER